MSRNYRHIVHGINLVPNSVSTISQPGDIDYSSDTGKFNFFGATSGSPAVTEDGVQTLTNKTINAPDNTITNISNVNIATNAAISFSKLATLSSANILVGNGGNVATAVSMSGDVTISNTGVTTVGFVGGTSASFIASGAILANAATSANTASAIVRRDSSGNFSASTITANLNGNVTGNVTGNTSGTSSNVTGIVQSDHGGTGVANNAASTLTISGSFATTLTVSAPTSVTLPTTGTLATRAGVETLTNKTLTAPVISTIVNTGTLTLPTSTDTLVGRATTDTLTNKTINDASNTLSVTSTSIKSGVASAGDVLTSDGAGNTVFAPATSGSTFDYSTKAANLGLASSVGSNNLTVDLKTKAGTNPSGGDPVLIGFRNATLTTGTYSIRTVSSALTITAPSGATFAIDSGSGYIHVYAIDNAGTVELALAGNKIFDEGFHYNTTAISSGSTSGQVLYSTTARTNITVRYIGRLRISLASSGVYATAPIVVATTIDPTTVPRSIVSVYAPGVGAAGYGSVNTKIRRFTTVLKNEGTAISYGTLSTLGDTFEILEDGMYSIMYQDRRESATANLGISINSSQLTTNIQSISNLNILAIVNTGSGLAGLTSVTYYLRVGDIIRAHSDGGPDTTDTFGRFVITKVSN